MIVNSRLIHHISLIFSIFMIQLAAIQQFYK